MICYMTIATDSHIGFSPGARDVVDNCRRLISDLRVFGEHEEARAATSFAYNLANLIGLGGNVTADGPLGLYLVTHYGMHVGMVFHADRTKDAAERIATHTGASIDYVSTLLIDTANPTPGEWSCHS